MSKHLERDLEALKRDILKIGTKAEEAVQKAITAFRGRNVEIARQIITEDSDLDSHEVGVEEECLKMLALHQPVAEDLRFIVSVIKINNDLERMGDCAVKIARRVLSLAKDPPIKIPMALEKMGEITLEMVRGCLTVFVKKDTKYARELCVKDDDVDQCNRNIYKELRQVMHDQPDQIDQALDFIFIAQRLERIADLATNVAQDVVYLVEGEIIRHKGDEYPRLPTLKSEN